MRSALFGQPVVHDVSWEQVRELFHANAALKYVPNADPKQKPADLPLICFAAFENSFKRTDLRSGLSAICLDYDDTPQADFARVLATARAQAPHGIAHTTWKHGCSGFVGSTVRARLVIPFDGGEPIPLEIWDTLWAGAAQLFGAQGLDRQCCNPERCYYLPATNPNAPWPCWIESW